MTSKQKNIALLVGFLIVLLLSYQFALKKTLDASNEYEKLLKEKKVYANATSKISYLKQHNNYLDSILKINEIYANVSFQQTILNKVSKYAEVHDLKITSFNSPHVFEEGKRKLITYTLELEGSFSSLLHFVNFFENQRLGNMVSVNFIKKKDYRRNKNYLRVKIYLQKNK